MQARSHKDHQSCRKYWRSRTRRSRFSHTTYVQNDENNRKMEKKRNFSKKVTYLHFVPDESLNTIISPTKNLKYQISPAKTCDKYAATNCSSSSVFYNYLKKAQWAFRSFPSPLPIFKQSNLRLSDFLPVLLPSFVTITNHLPHTSFSVNRLYSAKNMIWNDLILSEAPTARLSSG